MSLNFPRANHLTFEPVEQTSATLSDGNGVSISGVLKSLDVKFGVFHAKQVLLVVEILQYHAVLGMDFLVRHNPFLSFQKRAMTFAFDTRWGHRMVALQAVASDPCAHRELNWDTFELSLFDALSKTIRRALSDMHIPDACVACITPTPTSSNPRPPRLAASDTLLSDCLAAVPLAL